MLEHHSKPDVVVATIGAAVVAIGHAEDPQIVENDPPRTTRWSPRGVSADADPSSGAFR